MHGLPASFALVILASIFQGTFGLGMKYVRPLAWEAWWLVYSFIAMVLVPVACAVIFVPDLMSSIGSAPPGVVWKAMLFGFLWGVGGILFGKSVERIGIALTYGIVMGLAASVGSLVPLASEHRMVSTTAFRWIVGGNLLMLVGVAISALAGVRRENLTSSASQTRAGATGLRAGLAMAILCGLLSALLNIGFVAAQPIAGVAVMHGAVAHNASFAAWVVVLVGAFVMNGGYAVLLLSANGTWRSFGVEKAYIGWKWALASGMLWFAALGVYGQGAALMGSLGPVVGWPMLLGLALIVSNGLAVHAGEWKGAGEALQWMVVAVAILLIACCCLGYSNRVLHG